MYNEQPISHEIRHYLALAWRWLWLIALATTLTAGAAFLASRRVMPIYEASTTLLINEGQRASGPDYDALLLSERLARTYAQTLTARPLLEEAASQLGIELGGSEVSVEPVRDTQLILLKARHPDADKAAAIANTVVQTFVEQHNTLRSARITASLSSLEQELAALQAEIEATEQSLAAERSKQPPDMAEIDRLDDRLGQQRDLYRDLFRSRQELRAADVRDTHWLVVVEPAAAPSEPVLPRTKTNTLLAGIAGAMLASGLVLAIDHLDDRIRRPDDVERLVGLPTLATVGRFGRRKATPALLMLAQPGSPAAESYRLLRTTLQLAALGRQQPGLTILVTSAGPLEGKTTTLANLGLALAQAGRRVLLVDTDLRRPALHEQFGLTNEAGLTTLLLEPQGDSGRAVQETSVEGLRVITSGPLPANPAEVLAFPQTARLLDQLKSLADFVLLDSPPALGMADAGILAQGVDGVLLVAEAGRTRAEALKNAAASLAGMQAPLLGVVLNKWKARRIGDNYHRHYRARKDLQRFEPVRAGPQNARRGQAPVRGV